MDLGQVIEQIAEWLSAQTLTNWVPIIQLTVSALLTVVGWFVLNSISNRGKRKQLRDDKKYEYLIEAYSLISALRSNDFSTRDEMIGILTQATTKISLYGSESQIEYINGLAVELGNRQFWLPGSENLRSLSKDLRDEIRQHLGLSKLKSGVPSLAKGSAPNKPKLT